MKERREMADKKPYYITTAIAYTSGKPHIGNTYEIVLADNPMYDQAILHGSTMQTEPDATRSFRDETYQTRSCKSVRSLVEELFRHIG